MEKIQSFSTEIILNDNGTRSIVMLNYLGTYIKVGTYLPYVKINEILTRVEKTIIQLTLRKSVGAVYITNMLGGDVLREKISRLIKQ